MPFEIVRNDIVNMHVDAIVNTANPKPIIGPGVDSALHKRAGNELLKAREQIGEISVGNARITEAFQLHAKYVIHTVGPIWNGGLNQETELLRSCYRNSLELALKYGCESIAFPLISTGAYGFPKEQALETALGVISSFLMHHKMMVYLVVFDKTAYLKENGVLCVAHGMSRAEIDSCHRGKAKHVSNGLIHENKMEKLFELYFEVETKVSNQDLYVVVGKKRNFSI